jgi:hypothetical protein
MHSNVTPDVAPFPLPDAQLALLDDEEGNFMLEVSDVLYVTRGIHNGRALRFTVTWAFKHPKYGLLGQSEEGWLCTRDAKGKLRVSPSIARFGNFHHKQFKLITENLHDLLLAMLVNNKTTAGRSYTDEVGMSPRAEQFRAKRPGDVVAELDELGDLRA